MQAPPAQAPLPTPRPQIPPPASPQPKPVTGFVPPYEITRTVRAAGFDPLVRPLREGSTYVLRATDFRGILMRVVLDARTGAIRDVSRIVPADPDQIGMVSPPPGSLPRYGYEPPTEYGAPAPRRAVPAALPAVPPAASMRQSYPPLPHPRPAGLTAQKIETPADPPNPPSDEPKIGVRNAGAKPSAPADPSKTPPPAPFND
jgi:hypothetical protein